VVAGFRSRSITLVTTLTDPDLYPAAALRELYAKRWNVELHFHRIKIALGMDILRCQSPEMIGKEILVHLIAYNLVRTFMQRSAHIHRVDLARMSFKGSLDTARHFAAAIHAAGATPRKQDALIAEMLSLIASDPLALRPNRSEPRARKRRPKNYQLLTRPRSKMGNLPHRNRRGKNHPKPTLS